MISVYFIPVFFIAVLIYSLIKKVKPYDAFTDGTKQAIPFAISIFPYLASIFVMTELFELSGLSAFFNGIFAPVFGVFGIPKELTPLVLIKPFSGSGALATLSEIYSTYGVDGYLARAASAIYGSSETVFYIAAVYFAGAKTKNLVKPIIVSLVAGFFSCVAACLICRII